MNCLLIFTKINDKFIWDIIRLCKLLHVYFIFFKIKRFRRLLEVLRLRYLCQLLARKMSFAEFRLWSFRSFLIFGALRRKYYILQQELALNLVICIWLRDYVTLKNLIDFYRRHCKSHIRILDQLGSFHLGVIKHRLDWLWQMVDTYFLNCLTNIPFLPIVSTRL